MVYFCSSSSVPLLHTVSYHAFSVSSLRIRRGLFQVAFTPLWTRISFFRFLHFTLMSNRLSQFTAIARDHLSPPVSTETSYPQDNEKVQRHSIPILFLRGTSLQHEVDKQLEEEKHFVDSNEFRVWRLLEVTRRRLRGTSDEDNFERWAERLEAALEPPDEQPPTQQYYRFETNCNKILRLIERTWAEDHDKRTPFVRLLPSLAFDNSKLIQRLARK